MTVALCLAIVSLADIQYEQTSRASGGSRLDDSAPAQRLKEPKTTVRTVKGNRMATVTPSASTIYDLAAGTVTTVNLEKKTYTVVTLDQVKETQRATQSDNGDKWTVRVDDVGDERTIAGFKAHHFKLTMIGEGPEPGSGAKMILDQWMAKDVPGSAELDDFYKKLSEKLGVESSPHLNPMVRARLGKAWDQFSAEFKKMQGFTVLSVMKVFAAQSTAAEIEFTIEMTKLASGSVDESPFSIPPGFQQVR